LSDVPPVVFVPGILGSELLRPDGTPVWLSLANALGYHDLHLPLCFPHNEQPYDLVPGRLVGTDGLLPRLFGFRAYEDFVHLLEAAGFRRHPAEPGGLGYHVFTYDWRRDVVWAARRLHQAIEQLAEARRDRNLRVTVIGHSLGALVARHYLRYGTEEAGPG